MKLKLMAGAAVVAFLAASSAHAEWYAGFDVGYNNPHVTNLESSERIAQGSTATAVGAAGSAGTNFVPGDAGNLDYRFISDENIAGFARLGYRAAPNVRVELEVGERRSDLEAFGGPAGSGPISMGIANSAGNTAGARFNLGQVNNVRGEFRELSIMANALYDFAPDSVINPYLGIGAGMVNVELQAFGTWDRFVVGNSVLQTGAANFANYQSTALDTVGLRISDDQWVGALQGLAGLSIAFNDNIDIDVTYRYLRTADLEFNSRITDTAGTSVGAYDAGVFNGHRSNETVSVGLRYAFGDVAPPAQPAAVAREFVVYFPFDQFVLTPDAQAVVRQAADYARNGRATRVVVVGHTDSSGSPAYNQRLSENRAKAVADALVTSGVAQTTIQVDWKGESQLAVPTGDGVKEPLNRRSTISVNFR